MKITAPARIDALGGQPSDVNSRFAQVVGSPHLRQQFERQTSSSIR